MATRPLTLHPVCAFRSSAFALRDIALGCETYTTFSALSFHCSTNPHLWDMVASASNNAVPLPVSTLCHVLLGSPPSTKAHLKHHSCLQAFADCSFIPLRSDGSHLVALQSTCFFLFHSISHILCSSFEYAPQSTPKHFPLF